MEITRRTMLATSGLAALPLSRTMAQSSGLKIGVLNDQSGPYRDNTGMGSVVCAQQAVAEWGTADFPVQVVFADHQNKPDIGVSIARQWIDRDGVDMLLDVPTSSVALAVAAVVKERNKVMVNSGGGTADLTGVQCTPNTIHWTYDTYMLSRSTATQLVQLGGKKWFFITADYIFGQQLERDCARFVRENGGTVVGRAAYPFPETTDFSSYLLQAQASGAEVIGFASAGADTVNGVKQAHEFGLGKLKLAALLAHPSDVEAIGPDLAQGLFLTNSFYWDMNDGTRRFTAKVVDRMPQKRPPNMIHAGCYAGTLHYLKAVKAVGLARAKADGAAVVAQMKALPTHDDAFVSSPIRADGRALFPAYLLRAKAPKDYTSQWGNLDLVATTPGDEAWRPVSEGGCAMVKA